MSVIIYAMTPSFAAEVGDVDLSKPLADSDLSAIKQAFWKYAVLIFPEQNLAPKQHVAFSEQMWDNRCTMHRGTDYDDLRWVRDMQRTTVSDVANTCEQEGVAMPA